MRRIIAFVILVVIKFFSRLFYQGHYYWTSPSSAVSWKEIRLFVFMNHTSLFEPLFIQILPVSYLWHIAGHAVVPGADVTLNRPIVGRFWKLMVPKIIPVTRKKDQSWDHFLSSIGKNDVVMIAPEGRMKRKNGLDKFGRPMTIRGGVADIISNLNDGKILLCLSGGLHHIQSPGEIFPKLFKSFSMNLEWFDAKEYISRFPSSVRERKIAIIKDLQYRLEHDCPTTD